MRINPAFIELIGDVLIPILGYFLWDWSIYFILLFVFLDLTVREVIVHLKTNRDRKSQTSFKANDWIKRGVISLLLLLLFIVVTHVAMPVIQPEIQFKDELISFLSYEEFGIQQGYFLGLIVVLIGYTEMKKPEPQQALTERWKSHLFNHALLLVLASAIYLILNVIHLTDELILLLIFGPVILIRLGAVFLKK